MEEPVIASRSAKNRKSDAFWCILVHDLCTKFWVCTTCGGVLATSMNIIFWSDGPMDATKNEKSLDNRCAARVSRERRAPRAGRDCKCRIGNGLQLVSAIITARGAQVSRAARDPNVPFSRPACRALLSLHGVAGATPSRMRVCPERESKGECHSITRMSGNVTGATSRGLFIS